MSSPLSNGFGSPGGHVWLNAAHQGALPLAAAEAAAEAIRWKLHPHHLTAERFHDVPEHLRAVLARLLDVPAEQVALANSASYGLHVIVHTFPWETGDEVLLVANDFPSDLLPWRLLRERGVSIRLLTPAHGGPGADEVAASIGPRTRLFCSSWVYSLSGHAIDLAAVGAACRERGVAFVVNASQGLGALPLAPASLSIDALVSVGFKWLCGPYGTGLLWLSPGFRERLEPFKVYWLTMMSEADLSRAQFDLDIPENPTARAYDVFEPASFFNVLPWHAAVEHLLSIGIDTIAAYDQGLVKRLLEGIDTDRFRILSPVSGAARSTLVFLSHRDASRNEAIRVQLEASSIHVSGRAGSLRVAPHLYNTVEEIEVLLEALHRAA